MGGTRPPQPAVRSRRSIAARGTRAELLGVESLPINGAVAAGLIDGGQGAEGREQVLVGEVGGVEVGGGAGAPEEGAERGQRLPEVGVWGAGEGLGEAAEATGAPVSRPAMVA